MKADNDNLGKHWLTRAAEGLAYCLLSVTLSELAHRLVSGALDALSAWMP